MANKPSTLPKSLRPHNRYLAFEVISESKILLQDLMSAINQQLLNFLGELGTSKARPWLMRNEYDEKKNKGLIKCSHTHVEHVRAALSLIEKIGDSRVIVRVIGVSGLSLIHI